jgi:peptidoglycan/LPS O-acetylase OafA/YrhL
MIETNRKHILSLDGLRGLVAVLVVIHHPAQKYLPSHNIDVIHFPQWRVLDYWGHNSVLVFFCLSGFVLQWSMQDAYRDFSRYAFRRFFRLQPVLFASITSAIVLRLVTGEPIDPATVVRHYNLCVGSGCLI